MADTRNTGNSQTSEYMRLFSVGEVCALLGITRKTLFYYDRIGLAQPTARVGTQSCKVYDPSALEHLKEILSYRDAGLSISEIRILSEASEEQRAEVFRAAEQRLLKEQEEIKNKLEKLRILQNR